MRLATPEEMRLAERHAMDVWHVPGLILMENAARAVAEEAMALLAGRGGGRVVLAAGPGSNGGDAFACARHLLTAGVRIDVLSLIPIGQLGGDAACNARMLTAAGIRILQADDPDCGAQARIAEADVLVDGLYGTGLSRPVAGVAADWIRWMNLSRASVLAIDVPSGVDAYSGMVRGVAVQADATVACGLLKPGLVQYPGRALAGRVRIADLGVPIERCLEARPSCHFVDERTAAPLFPARPADLHKGGAGRVLIFAGSPGMAGAAVLAAASACRTGAGLVNLSIPDAIRDAVAIQLPEAVLSRRDDAWSTATAESARPLIDQCGAVLVGPGMGRFGDPEGFLRMLFATCNRPMVLDADALRVVAASEELAHGLPPDTILTPHPAEMAALCGMTTEAVQSGRLDAARTFATRRRVVLVLKGAGTVTALPDGTTMVNATGNAGMATAGSGDCLAGIIAALLAGGAPAASAAAAGVWLHGRAGDLAADAGGSTGLMASDIVNAIREARRTADAAGARSDADGSR